MWWMRDRKSWCFSLSKLGSEGPTGEMDQKQRRLTVGVRHREGVETEGADMFEVPGN